MFTATVSESGAAAPHATPNLSPIEALQRKNYRGAGSQDRAGPASPVTQAFGQMQFAILPIDKPQESRDSFSMRSGEATLCEDAQKEPSGYPLHGTQVPQPSLAQLQQTQDKLLALKQCQAIWKAADGMSQADTASSSESRRASPLLMPTSPPQEPLSTSLHQRAKPVQLSLKSALRLPADSNQIRPDRAALATMLLRQDRDADPVLATQAPTNGLPEEQLRRFAQFLATDFKKNLGRTRSSQRQSERLPRPAESNFLGVPAFAMLGYGGGNQAPLRSKAFSMQVFDPAFRSAEKSSGPQRLGSPQMSPCRRQSIRSLLLEPDMEDLASIWPRATDLNDLNGPDEEELDESVSERADYVDGAQAFFDESIFCSGPLSALPLTQAD